MTPTAANVTPLGDVVFVLPKPSDVEHAGSITLADVQHVPETSGLVVQVGSGFRCDACEAKREPSVAVGEWVLFPRAAGGEVTLDGTTYLVLRESEILAVIEAPRALGEVA